VLDGDPALPPLKGYSPQFSANVRCGQTTGWTKMSLGMEVGLGPGDFVFDENPAPKRKSHSPHPIVGPCLLWPNGLMDQLYATWYGGKPLPRRRSVRWVAAPPKRGTTLQFSVHVYCGKTAGWMKMPLGTFFGWMKTLLGAEVDIGPCHCVRRGPSCLANRAQQPPLFSPCLLWSRLPISATTELLF